MDIEQIADTIALLMILEPETVTCQTIKKLAEAGSATDEATDFSVLKEIKANKDKIVAELQEVGQKHLEKREKLIQKFLD